MCQAFRSRPRGLQLLTSVVVVFAFVSPCYCWIVFHLLVHLEMMRGFVFRPISGHSSGLTPEARQRVEHRPKTNDKNNGNSAMVITQPGLELMALPPKRPPPGRPPQARRNGTENRPNLKNAKQRPPQNHPKTRHTVSQNRINNDTEFISTPPQNQTNPSGIPNQESPQNQRDVTTSAKIIVWGRWH
jgi:hypothetical protein